VGQKVLSKPSADSFAVGRRQKDGKLQRVRKPAKKNHNFTSQSASTGIHSTQMLQLAS
jgi:hypothetical protein